MDYSGPPQGETAVPAQITAYAGGRPVLPVWVNRSGGVTFQLGDGAGRLFAKWAPAGSGLDLAAEAARLRWAADFTPVPRVLDHGLDGAAEWLVTQGLPGESAVSPRWKADPKTAVRALGAGLRALHDRLPVDECPFSWSVERRRAKARAEGLAARDQGLGVGQDLDLDLGLDLAHDPVLDGPAPPIDRLVVCHGDACAPNTLLDGDGRWSAHVDFGALGVADRWADLAVAVWNLDFNYGPGWAGTYYEAYGIAPDPERVAFYRRLGGVSGP